MRFTSLRGARGGVRQRSILSLVLVMGVLAMIMVLPATGLAKQSGKTGVVLQVHGSHLVAAGTSVTFTAIVRGSTFDKTKVTLERKVVGGDWVAVATKEPGGVSGMVTFATAVNRNADFRAVWRGPGLSGPKYSKSVKIKVVAKLTVEAEIGAYADGAGTPVTISGVLTPAWNSGRVFITVFGDDKVASFYAPLSAGVGDTSVFSATWNAMEPGTYSIRAKVARRGTTAFFGTSAWTEITL